MALYISRYCRIRLNSEEKDQVMIKTFDTESVENKDAASLYKRFSLEYPKYFKMDQVSRYGILAAECMFKGYDWQQKYSGTEVGIVLADAFGSLDTDMEFQKTIQSGDNFFPSPAIFVYTLSNIVMGEICIRYKIKGENMFFMSERLDAFLLSDYVTGLFDHKNIKAALTGWVDYINGQPEILLIFVENQPVNQQTNMQFNKKTIELLYS